MWLAIQCQYSVILIYCVSYSKGRFFGLASIVMAPIDVVVATTPVKMLKYKIRIVLRVAEPDKEVICALVNATELIELVTPLC